MDASEPKNCIFCRIVAGKAPAQIVHQDQWTTAFFDNSPVAPVHLLVVPNQHLSSLNEASAEDALLLGRLLLTARNLAVEHSIGAGWRLRINTGAGGGQTVFHLHLHVLGRKESK